MQENTVEEKVSPVKQAIITAFKAKGLLGKDDTKFWVKFENDTLGVEIISLVEQLFRDHPLLQVTTDVIDFCTKAGQLVPEKPTLMSDELKTLRMNLIAEEGEELRKACSEDDEIEERDATGDLIYVTVGHAVQRGTHSALDSDWNKIQASNMSKFPRNEEEAKDTVAHHKRQNVNCEKVQREDGSFVVLSLEEHNKGKLLKSKYYHEVKLEKIA